MLVALTIALLGTSIKLHNPTSRLTYCKSLRLKNGGEKCCAYVYTVEDNCKDKFQCAMFMQGTSNKASHIVANMPDMLLPHRYRDFSLLIHKALVDVSDLNANDKFLLECMPCIMPTRSAE